MSFEPNLQSFDSATLESSLLDKAIASAPEQPLPATPLVVAGDVAAPAVIPSVTAAPSAPRAHGGILVLPACFFCVHI